MNLITLHRNSTAGQRQRLLVNPMHIEYVTETSASGYKSIVTVADESFYVCETMNEVADMVEESFRKRKV